MGLDRYFDYEFDGDIESQADEIVHKAKDKLVDLIYGNVKSEIEEDRKNYERAKERADELQKECYEKREKINVLEIELKKVKEELERNDKLIPKTPFALGDEVWVTYRKYNDKGEVKCPMCNGEGYITALTDVYGTLKCVCPHCNNEWWKTRAEYDKYSVERRYIKSINIFIDKAKETSFEYGTIEDKEKLDVKDYNYVNYVNYVYVTKEEALKKAQELENESKKKAEEKIFGENR